MNSFNRTICIAPMMAYTDRHFRYLLRLISKHAVLYTEMITAQAIINGDRPYLLDFSEAEHPIAIQLGGSDPRQLAQAAMIAEQWGYDEINLNVGCPSERVQHGCFGAALMKEADLVSECMKAMRESVSVPVTIKTRLGVDDCDSTIFLHDFVGKIIESGCTVFIMHARKALLFGLSPKENRDIPPLQYDRVYQLKKCFPQLEIIINGGIQTQDAIAEQVKQVDGVMLGRVVCSNPYFLASVDQQFYADNTAIKSRYDIIARYLPYLLKQYSKGVPMRHMTRHLIGLFQGEPGAKTWRRKLSEAFGDECQLMKTIEWVMENKINSEI
ncbi:MAG: tRNA dihydrouridine(20/20a) synthase DusA [Gammaproteobacteria bacterium RIFCSPHIGHO2_02_FULL_39_13]|nr:MAG: tRNA dihydrouridine(20/20a) synthase DusA [Gammaproteobacteria bacterium RIFCSPHIGHO2_02_FULL_39_13]OGT49267.1 MAG: tRNA dihydrouridine(20/20a) synthase DusA [Gammaproteobacteria bacterium RIFCSPHIGHO2_12_FULL_39_24]